jgi:hypothetical protein
MNDTKARAWFGLTALAVLAGIVIQVPVAVHAKEGVFHTAAGRAFNVFCFFTVQSNVIVGVTSLLLAVNPNRSSTVFKTFRFTGVLAITVTGVVYHAVLRQLLDLESWALVADNLIHTVVPIVAVVGWLMFGPRGLTSRRVMWLSVLFPVAWLIFTMIRGPIVRFYPYPFIDVIHLGYGRVLVNCIWVAVLYLGLAAGFTALDRWLGRLQTTAVPDSSSSAI